MSFGEMMLSKLKAKYTVTENDLGKDAQLQKSGLSFGLRSYDIKDLGHFFLMEITGPVTAASAVLSVTAKQVPLFNLDCIEAGGTETLMAEFYNVAEDPISEEEARQFGEIVTADSGLENAPAGEHWYDPYLLPFSYRKTGRDQTSHFMRIAEKETDLFLNWVERAAPCDPAERTEKTRDFALSLLEQGGPAVDQFAGLFGRETAEKVVLEYMYGV